MTRRSHTTSRSFPGGHRSPRPAFAPVDPARAWRGLAAAVRGLSTVNGPAAITELLAARQACLGAAFPIEGEDAAACAGAVLELARAYPRAGEDARGAHLSVLIVAAGYCDLRLDQADAARMARDRSRYGGE